MSVGCDDDEATMALSDLAAAVIASAVHDAEGHVPHLRDRARRFLAGGVDFSFWCHVAGGRPEVVQRAFSRRRRT